MGFLGNSIKFLRILLSLGLKARAGMALGENAPKSEKYEKSLFLVMFLWGGILIFDCE